MTVAGVSQSSTVDVSIKQTEVETSSYQQQVTASTIAINEQILATQNSLMEHSQTQVKDLQDQMSPPPTMQEQHGKSSITVVDQKELRKLESQLAATQSQLASAQSAVENINSQQEALRGENSGQAAQTTQAKAELSQAEAQANSTNGHSGAYGAGVNTNASVTGSNTNTSNSGTSGNTNSNGNNGAIKETSAGTEAST